VESMATEASVRGSPTTTTIHSSRCTPYATRWPPTHER
jgi:hypothetical protein